MPLKPYRCSKQYLFHTQNFIIFSLLIRWVCREPELEGLEVVGSPTPLVDHYEWLLTRLCSLVSTATPDFYLAIEEALLTSLLRAGPPLTRQLACDVWCFVARYGSSTLCLSHLELISGLYLRLDPPVFSTQRFWLGGLIGRLFSFLAPSERRAWAERFPPSADEEEDKLNLELWALVDLGLLRSDEDIPGPILELVSDVTRLTLARVLVEQDEEISVSTLTSSFRILDRLTPCGGVSISSGNTPPDPSALVLLAWEKLAAAGLGCCPGLLGGELLAALAEVTCSLVGRHLNRLQVRVHSHIPKFRSLSQKL
jgi:hypothetical protein